MRIFPELPPAKRASRGSSQRGSQRRPSLLSSVMATKEEGGSSPVREHKKESDEEIRAKSESRAGTPEELEEVTEDEAPEGSDEEDDESEDEDDELPAKRRRRARRNQFIDVEAEVDDDEDDDEDQDVLENDGFVQSDEEDVGGVSLARESARQREASRNQERFNAVDAQELADEMREKYGRSQATFRGDTDVVPQRLLLPSVHDPSIFGVNCRIGKEKEAVRALSRRLQNMRPKPEVFSCFQRDAFTGRVYIEARNQRAVLNVCKGIPNIYAQNSMLLVPIREYADLLTARKTKEVELVPGTYVRIKRGKYANDLALVQNLSESGLEVQLQVLPRLDYGRNAVMDSLDNKRKRTSADRPAARLFSATDAKQHDASRLQRQAGASAYFYNGDEYVNGYLIKDFKLTHISTENVNPSLEEIAALNSTSEGIDLQALSDSVRKDLKVQSFQPGETVEVTHGELMGMRGRVQSTNSDIVTIVGVEDRNKGVKVSLPTGHFRKFFSIGDHVRVTNGNYKDETGMVVARDKDQVTLLSDISKGEVTVFAKDLKMASDIGGSNTLGKYTLHDLIQLNAQTVGCIVDIEREHVKVLAQDGQVLTATPSSIIMKVTSGRQGATDHNGRQIEPGDTVREIGGERRQGTILHLYHSFVFLHNREFTENLGVFVNRVSNIATVATKGARDERGLNLSKMNPMVNSQAPQIAQQRSNFNARRIIGQKITIGPGSGWKGLKGLVKDVNDTSARVELEARNKIITVPVERLLFNGPNDTKIPFREYLFSTRGPPRTNMGPPGAPGSGGSGFGGPSSSGFGGSGGNFRNGGQTPRADGSKTPWSSGSKTPSWNSGSKTPAYGGSSNSWNSGSRTPAAWNSGAKTPAYGGRTSAWSSSSTSWDSGRSAPTPGGYGSINPGGAPTPGGYDSAPTPTPYATAKTPGAISVETPAAWGSDDEDEIQYEAETP